MGVSKPRSAPSPSATSGSHPTSRAVLAGSARATRTSSWASCASLSAVARARRLSASGAPTVIAARQADLARNLTEKLLAYALCRPLEGYDEIVVDRLMDTIAKDGYRMQALITEIVTSYPFTQRRIQ